jgi:hypothetical protein
VESSCERRNEPSGSIKCWDRISEFVFFIYRVAAQVVASRVVLSSTDLVSYLVMMGVIDFDQLYILKLNSL